MTVNRSITIGTLIALLLVCVAGPTWAARGRGDDGGRGEVQRDAGRPAPRGYVLDNRYHHNQYYPVRGHAVPALPRGYRVVPYRGSNYYFHAGVWYRPSGSRFVVVFPPVGLIVPVLPPFYTTIVIGGVPYYYADGIYYLWQPAERAYVVTEPPAESDAAAQTVQQDQMFIYPKQGQSEQKQATDRYQCHQWSVDQTGFDPTQPGGNVPESQNASKRADYQRAMKACLEARGYSVQ